LHLKKYAEKKNCLARSQPINISEIRKAFVEYFKDRDHKQILSSPVIPFDDPTILFANAGMNQFKDIFTGQKKAEHPRAVSVQKCMRAGGKHNDLENVGRTGRHHTFFEMLGNFSFGDYFKEEAIGYAWEFITKNLALPKDKLYATVYTDDDEAYALWEKIAPELKNGHILRFGRKDNYWSMGNIGPCGPCSEIHFDRGEKFGTGPEAVVNGESDRYVEIWNLVFMQYNKKPDGTIELLPKPSVDTGAGLERLACLLQNADSNYEIELFQKLIGSICDITGNKYSPETSGVSHRVIADHIRALTFCIADGGGLSNEKQGYVLRRILRRAARHGRKLNVQEPFIYKLVAPLVNLMGDVYPEIKEKQSHIENVIRAEEESFGRTLDTGLELFENVISDMKKNNVNVVSGKDVFKLCDTFGFPPDLTRVMAEELGFTIDEQGFQQLMKQQQNKSRHAVRQNATGTEQIKFMLDEILKDALSSETETEFVRDKNSLESKIIEIFEFKQGETPYLVIIPEKTPFYVESGGQVGDIGTISHPQFRAKIDTTINYKNVIVHIGQIEEKKYADLEEITDLNIKLAIDKDNRIDIIRNHTATHLLHAALRQVLGGHVRQSGSYVGPDKLRFDFSHFQPMTAKEKLDIEKLINARILDGLAVSTIEDSLESAKQSGAMAIFGEKYDNDVRVVSIGTFSKELCGGTHVDNISQIGPFVLTMETGIATGVRRIEAVTGREAIAKILQQKSAIAEIGEVINRPVDKISSAIKEMSKNINELQKENKKFKAEKFSTGTTTVGHEIKMSKFKFIPHNFGKVETEEMAGWVDRVKSIDQPLVTVATGIVDGKATYMGAANKASGVHIGKISKEVLSELGGRGGGKDSFAQGTYPSDLDPEIIFSTLKKKLEDSYK